MRPRTFVLCLALLVGANSYLLYVARYWANWTTADAYRTSDEPPIRVRGS